MAALGGGGYPYGSGTYVYNTGNTTTTLSPGITYTVTSSGYAGAIPARPQTALERLDEKIGAVCAKARKALG